MVDPLLEQYTPHRAYVYNSWIEGHTDYIWGSGDVLIENSTFYNTGNDGGSVITASRTSESDKYGYVIKDCTVTVMIQNSHSDVPKPQPRKLSGSTPS